MRLTLDLDDDVLVVAKSLAASRRITLGKALSELARIGINTPVNTRRDPATGWMMFEGPSGKTITSADVQHNLEEDDLGYAVFFHPRS